MRARTGSRSCGGACASGSACPTRRSASRPRARACARTPPSCELPARIALFGLTRLPAAHLAVLDALAAHRDVHLLLLHPSPALWDAVAAATAGRPPVRRRAGDPTAAIATNRLLASWGRTRASCSSSWPLRAARSTTTTRRLTPAGRCWRASRPTCAPIAARRARRCPPTTTSARSSTRPTAASRSTRATAAPARWRSLRDAILHALAEDPTLEPRDVIVMCPDIEAFAPLIQATFGAGETVQDEEDDAPAPLPPGVRPPDLRVRLADRALRQTNPVLGVVAGLLELAERRLTASEVLDLAGREPVRRRFGLDDDDLARLEEWVGRHRHPLGARRRPPRPVQARQLDRRHLARRAGPRAASAWR